MPFFYLVQSPDYGGAIFPRQEQRFQQAECKAERSSCSAEARKRRRIVKAFESNSKGIELLDTHLAVSRR